MWNCRQPSSHPPRAGRGGKVRPRQREEGHGFGQFYDAKGGGWGSAFCIDSSGIFVTNDHVAAGGANVRVLDLILNPGVPGERRLSATIIHTDPKVDLAILRVENAGVLDTIELADPAAMDALAETTQVSVYGYPFGGKLALRKGAKPEISVSVCRIMALRHDRGELEQIQADGAVNPGNSGGPLVDEKGRVVGVVRAGIPGTPINFAIPTNRIRTLLAKANIILTPKALTAGPTALGEDDPAPTGPRQAVPDEASRALSLKVVRELYSQMYADQTPRGRLALAAELFGGIARLTPDEHAARYVMLRESFDVAVAAADSDTAFRAADELGRRFDVDAVAMKLGAIPKLAPKMNTEPQSAALFAASSLALARSLARRDDHDAARKLFPIVRGAATSSKNAVVVNQVRVQIAQFEALAADYDKARPAIDKLKAAPGDPDANLAVGRYQCFSRGDFARGLPLLVKSADGGAKAVAVADLADPTTPAARKDVGDLWWDQSSKETKDSPAAKQCQARAAYWYRLALPELSGLPKSLIEQRLGVNVPAPPAPKPAPAATNAPIRGAPLDPFTTRTRTRAAGGAGGGPFEQIADAPAVLVGFNVTLGGWSGHTVIDSVQPVFSPGDRKIPGKTFGVASKSAAHAIARPGYAVGGIVINTGDRIDGFKVIFMRRAGDRLVASDSYESPWIGGTGGGQSQLGGDGKCVIGVFGKSGSQMDSLGLVQGE